MPEQIKLRYLSVLILFLFSCNPIPTFENGENIIYYPGTKNIFQKVNVAAGKRNGLLEEFYKSGKIRVRKKYVADVPNDTAFFYNENGKISSIEIYDKGSKEGCWQKFNPEGRLFEEVCFHDDMKNGVSKKFSYKTVRLLEQLNFKEGYKVGKQEYFHNNGNKKSVCYYDDNIPCTGLQEWSETGNVIDNDFRVTITEDNKTAMKSEVTYIVTLQDAKQSDEVFRVAEGSTDTSINQMSKFDHKGDHFELLIHVGRGNMVMQKISIAAFRKTSMGNTYVKKSVINVAASNY